MQSTVLLLFSLLLFQYDALSDTVYKCKQGDRFAYQSTPCEKGSVVQKLTTQTSTPDSATLERLEQQRLEFLKQTNPAEYRRLRREKLPPTERLADERAEELERWQKMQTELELEQRERQQQAILREMEARRWQEWQLEQERLDVERKRWQQPVIILPPRQHHREFIKPTPALPQPPRRSLLEPLNTLRPREH